MKLASIKRIAAVSAVALCAAMYAVESQSAAVQIGDPVVVALDATVENTIDVTVTSTVDFGTLGAMNHTVDVATLILAPDSTVTEDPGGGFGSADPAAIVNDPADPGAAGVITVANAFGNTDLYITYGNCVDLNGPGAENFTVDSIQDDLDSPTTGVGLVAGDWDCAAAAGTIGQATTTVGGDLVFNIGATITTDGAANAAYTDGAYAGSVTATFSY